MTTYLGIDPALSNTAYVLLDENFKVIKQDVISTPPLSSNVYINSEQRILDIFNQFKFVPYIDDLYSVCIEDVGYMSKDRYLFERVGLIFMIRCFLFENDIRTTIVAPKSLKKHITGNGNADKQKMMDSVAHQFYQVYTIDHLADAFGLAVIAKWKHQGKIKI